VKPKGSPPSSRRPTLRELPPQSSPHPAPPSPPVAGLPTPFPSLPVPPASPVPQKFASEPPTKQKNVVASVYQSLLSVFDEMSAEQRMEFVDLASRYAALDADARADLLEIASLYVSLDAGRRAIVLEGAKALLEHG
jgi:hypothetical protein